MHSPTLSPPWLMLFLVLLPALASGQTNSEPAASSIAEQCDSCHATNAQISSRAPILDGLPRRYLQEQLLNFREGKRAASDQISQTMINQIQQLTASEMKDLARNYARKKRVFSSETVEGNPDAGQPLFEEHCSGCHLSAMGRRFTKSPPITHLNGNYILSQLQAFATNQRGFTDENKHKRRMVEVARQFNQTELANITAYIKSRDPKP